MNNIIKRVQPIRTYTNTILNVSNNKANNDTFSLATYTHTRSAWLVMLDWNMSRLAA